MQTEQADQVTGRKNAFDNSGLARQSFHIDGPLTLRAACDSSRSEPACTLKWADLSREAADPARVTGRPRDFPSVRKWDTLSLRIAVGCVQVIASREDY
jgi:hypothetical protein